MSGAPTFVQRPTFLQRLRALAGFLIASIMCGALVAALAIPAVIGSISVGRTGADVTDRLGAELDVPPPAGRSQMLLADGSRLAWFYDLNRQPVSLDKISPWMRKAQLAVENHRFYEQGPIDPVGVARALLGNAVTDGQTGGGSGITQQYVKMLLIEQALLDGDKAGVAAAQERSLGRKARELRYAIHLERKLSKDQILNGYLNLAYFGDGAYGVEAAAQHYFSTSAAELTLAQAALLAGIVKNPTAFNPVEHPDAALQRRNLVLDRMTSVGMITRKQAAAARESRISQRDVSKISSGCSGSRYPFICDAARRELLERPDLGRTPTERRRALQRGGLTIRLTVDPRLQRKVQRRVSDTVASRDPAISVMSLVEPGTGRVQAMAQSRPRMDASPGGTWYNHAMPRRDGGAEGYQAGSTFKAFTIAAALKQGWSSSLVIDSPASLPLNGMTFQSCHGPFTFYGAHRVGNLADRGFGKIPMTRAAQDSVNTYFVRLQQRTGLCAVATMADDLGVVRADGQKLADTDDQIATLTLGPIEVAPLSVANAYATLAAGGIRCDTSFIDKIERAGRRPLQPEPHCRRVLDADVARATSEILRGVMTDGSGRRARIPGQPDQAGKTGTTDDNQAVWFAGYTSELAGAGMVAIDKSHPWWKTRYRTTLKGTRLPVSGTWLDGTGGDVGRRIWSPSMQAGLGVDR